MLSDPRKFVAWWLSAKKITVDEAGKLINTGDRTEDELFDTLVLDYYEQIEAFNKIADKKIRGAPETHLGKALQEFVALSKLEAREKLIKSLTYSGAGKPILLEKFIVAMTGKAEPKIVAVMAHFIWQIKRKMNNMRVNFHLMPILLGSQEAGKSRLIEAFLTPVKNVTVEGRLDEITDSRWYFGLGKNFVASFNEMSGAKRIEIENLKRQITASFNTARKLGTNMISNINQNCTFIGSSNRPVNEIIFDSTGARRFYEIKTLELCDWETINAIDYIALYKEIDENREIGYSQDFKNEIAADQKHLIAQEELDVFMEVFNLKQGTREIASALVYEAYKTWAETNGIKIPLNSVHFGRKLSNRGIINVTKHHKGKTTRYYLIDEISELHRRAFDPLASDLDKPWN